MSELLFLPDSVTPTTASILALTTLVAATISGVTGIGGATILLGVMAVLLPPLILIPIHAVVQVASTGLRAILLLPHVRTGLLWPFIAGSAIGSLASAAVVIQLPPWAIQLGIAAFILWSVFGRSSATGKGGAALTGVLSGFLTMLFGATGPFVTAFVKTRVLPARAHVGTQAAMMVFQHAIKVGVFGLLGFAFAQYLGLLLILVTASLVGTSIGRLLLGKLNDVLFHRLLNGLLLALSARLVWQAIGEMFR